MYHMSNIVKVLSIIFYLGLYSLAQANRAQDFFTQGDYVRSYHAAMQDNDVMTASLAVWAHVTFKDPQNAIWIDRGLKAARQAVKQNPRSSDAYVQLSSMLGNRAELYGISMTGFSMAKESQVAVEKAVAISPENPNTLISLARWHSGAYIRGGRLVGGNPEKARSLATKALKLGRNNTTVLMDVAIILAELKDPRATKFLKKGLAIPPKNALERDWQELAKNIVNKLAK